MYKRKHQSKGGPRFFSPACRGQGAFMLPPSSINRQSTAHQIPRARSINSSVTLMISMGCCACTLLVSPPIRHMSHQPAVTVCCRRTRDYHDTLLSRYRPPLPARPSAIILLSLVLLRGAARRKHPRTHSAGGGLDSRHEAFGSGRPGPSLLPFSRTPPSARHER